MLLLLASAVITSAAFAQVPAGQPLAAGERGGSGNVAGDSDRYGNGGPGGGPVTGPLYTPRQIAAMAAGDRALQLCSGLFASEMSRDLVDQTNVSAMTRALADQKTPPNSLRTEIDQQGKTVSVFYADDMPPRMVVWRPVIGCTALPIGATQVMAAALPRPASIVAPKLDDRPWPMGDRDAVRPLPPARQAAVDKVIEDEAFKASGGTWGVLVIKDGKIVAERYRSDFGPHIAARAHAWCKSFTATLAGIGVQKGILDIHRKAPLAEWRAPGDPRGEITIDNMLRFASGLYIEGAGNPGNDIYSAGRPVSEVDPFLMVDSKPGTRWQYSNSDIMLTERAMHEAVNDDTAWLTYPYRELFWKLGMTRTVLDMDWKGDFLSGDCWSTARDFGRYGMLYLADGVWNGERILPAGWTKYVSTPQAPQPAPTQYHGIPWGAGFWVYGGIDGLPADAFTPWGAVGEWSIIVPSKNMVIVRRGLTPKGFKITKFAADIIAAAGE